MAKQETTVRVVNTVVLVIFSTIVGIIIASVYYTKKDQTQQTPAPAAPAPVTQNPQGGTPASPDAPADPLKAKIQDALGSGNIEQALNPEAQALAKEFMCVCGCGDILAICQCTKNPGSVVMKQFLQEQVDEGKTPDEVREAMIARFGPGVIPSDDASGDASGAIQISPSAQFAPAGEQTQPTP